MSEISSPEEISAQLYRYDRIADKWNGFENWGQNQLGQYRKEGYTAIEHVLNQKEIEDAKSALYEIIFVDDKGAQIEFTKPSDELKSEEERELAVRKVSEFVEVDERFKQIAHHPAILAAVQDILGEEPRLVQDMALLKPPHGGGEKPWHQDMAYGRLAYEKAVVGVWLLWMKLR